MVELMGYYLSLFAYLKVEWPFVRGYSASQVVLCSALSEVPRELGLLHVSRLSIHAHGRLSVALAIPFS